MAGVVPHLAETNLLRIVQAIRDLFEGRSNAVGDLTLTANVASTSFTVKNCGSGSKILLTATTANAAAEIAAGGFYVSAVASGSFTITHANNAQTDRAFYYAIQG